MDNEELKTCVLQQNKLMQDETTVIILDTFVICLCEGKVAKIK